MLRATYVLPRRDLATWSQKHPSQAIWRQQGGRSRGSSRTASSRVLWWSSRLNGRWSPAEAHWEWLKGVGGWRGRQKKHLVLIALMDTTPWASQSPANSTRGLESPSATCKTSSNLASQQLCLSAADVDVGVPSCWREDVYLIPPLEESYICQVPYQGSLAAKGMKGLPC